MKIKEMESRSGIDRATIRYYEKESLLEPERTDNGYREYSGRDYQLLMKIRLLRSLHISLEDIRNLIRGKISLRETVSSQTKLLDKEEEDISYAKEMCRTIYKNEMNFESLDAEKYLIEINHVAAETGTNFFQVKEELPMVYDPLKRFFARGLDLALYQTLWLIFLVRSFHINIGDRRGFISIVDLMAAVFLMILIEPMLIRYTKTTPGKYIFGLRIENADGNKLSYLEAFDRTWGVALKGLGLTIPFVSFITLGVSYNRSKIGQIQPWDEDISYRIKDRKIYRYIVFGMAGILLILGQSLVEYSYYIAPHQGDLTVEKFVENFNHYAEIYDIDFRNAVLEKSGAWKLTDSDFRYSYLPNHLQMPHFRYTLERGTVTGVSLFQQVGDTDLWIESLQDYMLLSSLALASEKRSLLDEHGKAQRIIDEIYYRSFESFELTELGVTIKNEVENIGYDARWGYMRKDRGFEEYYFRQQFSVTK